MNTYNWKLPISESPLVAQTERLTCPVTMRNAKRRLICIIAAGIVGFLCHYLMNLYVLSLNNVVNNYRSVGEHTEIVHSKQTRANDINKTGGQNSENRQSVEEDNEILFRARDCIEENICKDSLSDIYIYRRTDFDKLVELPINYNASINHTKRVVPRKVHFCLFSNGSHVFRFHYMIAVMAVARHVKPDSIYFWHDNLPVGQYWEETKAKVKNLYLVRRERPRQIRGQNVSVVEHVADIVRLEVLLEYGGMYFDTDSIVVNPVDSLLVYDVTMGHAVPYVLANGIMFSKPWSDFFKIWHHEYSTFNDKDWGGHSVIKPFQLAKKYGNLIHIEASSLCRPNWREMPYIFGRRFWDWKNNNYVVHLYMRLGPKVESTPENIKGWNTTAGSIMRYIYYGDSELWNKTTKH